MEFKQLTKKVKIPVLGFGTYLMGGRLEADYSEDKKCIAAIKEAIRLGMTHIDTAENYGAGHAEELVGKAIKDFDRKKLFITTKVKPENLHYNDLINSAKASLKRLGIDYLDLYLIHKPNPQISIKETMRALDFLVEKKLVRFIGVSNFSVEQIKGAQKQTKNKILANQVEYNLLVRNKGRFTKNMEKEILPYCQKNNILFIAWRPLLLGILARKGLPLLDKMATKYDKTRAQVALNWLLSKKNIITIVKSTNLEHLKENLGALGWKLREEDQKELDNWEL